MWYSKLQVVNKLPHPASTLNMLGFHLNLLRTRRLDIKIRLPMQIHAPIVEEIHVDGKYPRDHIPQSRHQQGEMRALRIHDRAHSRREDHAATNGGHLQTAAHLRMASEAPQAQGEDGREASALEGKDEHQQRDGRVAAGVHGRDGEGKAQTEEGQEDESRLDHGRHHGEAGDEAHARVDPLCGGEERGGGRGGSAGLFAEFDEVVGYGYLGADVGKLGEGTEEEIFS